MAKYPVMEQIVKAEKQRTTRLEISLDEEQE